MPYSTVMTRSNGSNKETGTPRSDETSDMPLTVWSISQFEKCRTTFSHGLAQLQHCHTLASSGESTPDSTALLMSTIVSTARAMTQFLQRRHTMMQRLQGLGRVVETECSKTWYAQPETLWLRRAVADLKAKCDAFSWLVMEICRVCEGWKPIGSPIMAQSLKTKQGRPAPTLRSYNSFSSIGSETPFVRSRRDHTGKSDSNAPTPTSTTNPFSDSSSSYSRGIFSTGPSSLEPNSPVDSTGERSPTSVGVVDPEHSQEGSSHEFPEHLLVERRHLLELVLTGLT